MCYRREAPKPARVIAREEKIGGAANNNNNNGNTSRELAKKFFSLKEVKE